VTHYPEQMLLVACVLAALAALVHVYIFVLESLRWTDPGTRRVFGTTEETAAITAPLAYNQGFYNLFLAIGTAVGIALVPSDAPGCRALIVFGTGSMLAAALVLITSDRSKARAAAIQGTLPALALLALLVHALR
jgi:putative membrane protein